MSRDVPHILLVDDEPETLSALAEGLHEEGCACITARSASEALSYLEDGSRVDVVITDLRMPEMDGLELTRHVKQKAREIDVIILTAHPTMDTALLGGRLGASNYMTKPVEAAELWSEVKRLLRRRSVNRVGAGGNGHGRRKDRLGEHEADADALSAIVGAHPSVQELKKNVLKLAKLSAPVLILGESGTGKELVARALHGCGDRRSEPFLGVNCGAIPRHLLESELFGYKRGAFTGANRDRAGLFVSAGRGTLFLDEIAELDQELQVKLLRSLQEKEVSPVGSDAPVSWCARLVCATNIDVDRAVMEGRFREDLYYRINVLRLEVPSLRERRCDIPLLADWFLRKHDRGLQGSRKISDEALELLCDYDWPGNVRQLENFLVRSQALATSDRIEVEDLPAEIRPEPRARHAGRRFPTYDQMAARHIKRALRATGGVRTAAARLLAIDRNRLSRMIKRYEIDVGEILREELSDRETEEGEW